MIATAILDRILHHASAINVRGNSYRLEDKIKAGLVPALKLKTRELSREAA